jgi:hypothetical protein
MLRLIRALLASLLLVWIARQYRFVRTLLSGDNEKPPPTPGRREPTTTPSGSSAGKILYVGQFGLGHRLSKLSAAYHLWSKQLREVPVFEVRWGRCKETGQRDEEDIFIHLFGTNHFFLEADRPDSVPSTNVQESGSVPEKIILIRNDVSGYFAGQNFKNAQVPVASPTHPEHAFLEKMRLDRTLLAHLYRQRFTGRHLVDRFRREYKWDAHTVVGLHVRAGNGEKNHFEDAQRGGNWAVNGTYLETNHPLYAMALKIRLLLESLVQQSEMYGVVSKKHPLVFLATDTAPFIPVFNRVMKSSAIDIPVVVFQQNRLSEGQGVSYSGWTKGSSCLQGWIDAATDQALLAASDIVIAAARSTFTQTLPLSSVLSLPEDAPPTTPWSFCEMDLEESLGNPEIHGRMTCFRDAISWLFRQETAPSSMRTFSLLDCAASTVTGGNACSSSKRKIATSESSSVGVVVEEANQEQVFHKVMVHLPDIDEDPLLEEAKLFLRKRYLDRENNVFAYGERINKKYRGKKYRNFQNHWTFARDGDT